MNSNYLSNEKLVAFLNGELSPEESESIRDWYAESTEGKQELEQLEQVWGLADRLTQMEGIDKKRARNNIELKLSAPNHKWKVFRLYFQKAAAILIFPILLLTTYVIFQKQDQNIAEQEIVAAYGTRSQITLPDGSKVWLNSGSTLQYGADFNRNSRTVHLMGEAYFEVQSDQSRPFDVVTEKYTVRAVGTAFNIFSYDKDEFYTSLEKGHTQIFKAGQQDQAPPLLKMTPGQRVVLNQEQNKLVLTNTNVSQYSTWREGKLTFKNTPMEEVIAKLKRWFNVTIELKDREALSYRYTAVFENETIQEVLEMLSFSAPIDYRIIPGKSRDGDSSSKPTIEISIKKSKDN